MYTCPNAFCLGMRFHVLFDLDSAVSQAVWDMALLKYFRSVLREQLPFPGQSFSFATFSWNYRCEKI